jgi:hypothetical protein
VNDYVLGLNIAVNNSKGMYLVDCITDLLDDWRHFCFLHWLRSFELMKELSSSSDFKNDKDMSLVVKISIHLDDIRMIEVHLYL